MKPENIQYAAAGVLAGLFALILTLPFQDNMPMADWFFNIESSFLFPLSALNLVFHEAGHWIFGILGIRFITIAGGTIMQLVFPVACLVNFLRVQKSWPGVLFSLFWIGENLMEISWYMADAKMQALILITGMSGREGGGHDWGNMLGMTGLTDYCVGMGETVHWAGCTLALFPFAWLAIFLWQRFFKTTG